MYSIDIQHARPSQLESIIDVATIAYNDHYTHLWSDGGKSYVSESFNTEAFRRYFGPSIYKSLYYIKLDGKLIGFLSLGFGYDNEGVSHSDYMELERLYIVKEATGKGIGKEVVKFIESTALENGHQFIWLKAMKKSPAVQFYQNHGWKITGVTFLEHPQVIPAESEMYVMSKNIIFQWASFVF